MSLAVILAWIKANEAALATIAFIISELLGASPRVKSNGLLSFVLLQVQENLKKRSEKPPAP